MQLERRKCDYCGKKDLELHADLWILKNKHICKECAEKGFDKMLLEKE